MSETDSRDEDDVREIELAAEEEKEKKKGMIFSALTFLFILGVPLVLAAILVPNFIRARSRGQLTACKSNLKNIGTALEMYSTDWAGKYPQGMGSLTPDYLKTIPTCPSAGSMTYTYKTGAVGYNISKPPFNDYYILCCGGESHHAVSVPSNYPQYDGLRGLYER